MAFVLQRYVCIYIIKRNSPRYGKADHYFYIHRKRNNDRLKREKKIESKKLFK